MGDLGITWEAETEPVPDERDAADDVAIWLSPDDPSESLIVGTNKKGDRGLLIYDLAGRELAAHGGGAMNNVDLRTDVPYGDRSIVLVAATSVEGRTLELLELDPIAPRLVPLPNGTLSTGVRSAGLCLWRAPQGGVFAIVTAGSGRVQQWALTDPGGAFEPSLVRELALDTRVEGCVADDVTGNLFLAEESTGVWRVPADARASAPPELVDEVGGPSGLASDVEGIAIARYDDGRRYLVVSSQGTDRFIVYRLGGTEIIDVIDGFRVRDADGEDHVEHTDGIDVVVGSFGDGPFRDGLLVVQDDDNEDRGGEEQNQNFKLVPWHAVESLLALN